MSRTGSRAAMIEAVTQALAGDTPIRLDLDGTGRLYLDRPMPYLAIHVGRRNELAARQATAANTAYLIARTRTDAIAIASVVGEAMKQRFGAFLILDIGELERDDLAEDAPYLAPFEVSVSTPDDALGQNLASTMSSAIEKMGARYRAPQIRRLALNDDPHAGLAKKLPQFPVATIRFAPIYRAPVTGELYPHLHELLVANIFDAGLQGVAAFARAATSLKPPTHRALGRRVYIDAVARADRAIDDIATRFDFLLAVTPINAEAAWAEFKAGKFKRAPAFLYRPLSVDVEESKRALFSVALDHFEDPVLGTLYREKQQELDLQLSLLAARETPRFIELGRALYGSVEPRLLKAARSILEDTKPGAKKSPAETADYRLVEKRARAMIARYSEQSSAFATPVEVRDDLPSGLMVSNGRLLISRSTAMDRARVEPLLSHEVGVHMLTYFNGSGHGLRLFRTGLAGYEGTQEGLAVLAEYLAGGMTIPRLRLIAARVLACAEMLDGASFADNFALLTKSHGFSESGAFNLLLRVYRGGGLAKDAIYLRGLLEILAHLGNGGSLDPFWLGKIAASHFGIIQELAARGLLGAPRLVPQFLTMPGAADRLDRLKSGAAPIDLIAS
jgi:uncharacterized protein (TIGR02421 family)